MRDTHHVPHSPVISVEGGTASRHAAARKQAAKYAQAEEMRAHGQPADRTKSRKAHAPLRTDDWSDRRLKKSEMGEIKNILRR